MFSYFQILTYNTKTLIWTPKEVGGISPSPRTQHTANLGQYCSKIW